MRGYARESIIAALRERVLKATDVERAQCLLQIEEIAALRLADLASD